MSRMLKSKLPTSASLLKPRVVEKAQEKLKERSDRQKMYYDRNAKPLPQIREDDTVRIRKGKTWEPAIVSEKHTAPRSFIVTTPDGTAYRRNRCHLLPTIEAPPVVQVQPMMTQLHLLLPHPQLILHPQLLLAMMNYLL